MKKILFGIVIFMAIVSLVVGAGYLTYSNVVNVDTIYPGISIEGVDVSNLSEKEALEKLTKEDTNLTKDLKLHYADYDFAYSYESLGYNPDYKAAVKEAYDYAKEGTPGERFLKVTELKTEPLDIKVQKEFKEDNINEVIAHLNNVISFPPVDANLSVVNDEMIITKEQPGFSVDNNQTKELIINSLNSGEVIQVPVNERVPEITSEYFSVIKGDIGSFSTNYSTSIQNRKENIKLAARLIDGTVIMPGQQISFNEEIGEISAATGFLPATVILEGEYDTGTGGGICQVSTTLYNAAVKADLQVDERRNHSRPVNYVPLGLDAAVASGLLDLKITNSFDFPVYIKAKADDNDITFSIVGDTDKKNYDIELVSERSQVLGSNTKTQYTSSISEGNREVVQSGYTGYRYSSYKIKSQNGEVISREPYLASTYPARDTIINVGTGRVASTQSDTTLEGGN